MTLVISKGITLANEPFRAITATGGDSVFDITIGGTRYRVHTFTTVGSSTFTVTDPGSGLHPAGLGGANAVEYLVVAGGGSGGSQPSTSSAAAGGGAGGMQTGTLAVSPSAISVTIGAGGIAPAAGSFVNGLPGSNSSFATITSIGGGGGRGTSTTSAGINGGSGGGGRGGGVAGTGISGQGNGGGGSGNGAAAGGGGGAGAVGGTGDTTSGFIAQGGAGLASTITGSSVTYARGGDSGPTNTVAAGANGTNGLGDGGQGSGSDNAGGNGGSGIVIVRYAI